MKYVGVEEIIPTDKKNANIVIARGLLGSKINE